MKVILMTAYDINPYKGSEAGTGWNFVIQAARFNRVMAVTRENNRQNIDEYIKEFNVDTSNLDFYYFDLPYWLRFWKKGSRGSSLYFYIWQLCMPMFVKRNKINFDIAHNVNFHADAFPSFLWLLGKPLVWGPISHHEKIPYNYIYGHYLIKYYVKDRMSWIMKKILWNFDPMLKLSILKSTFILAGHTGVIKQLSLDKDKTLIFPQVASENIESDTNKISNCFDILFVGRLIPLKGADIAIRSFAKYCSSNNNNSTTFTIIGKGSEKNNLISLVKNLKIEDKVFFVDWIDKVLLDRYYKKANLFLFPSHEGAGMVIAEALSYGLPVLCFDNFGPGELVDNSCAIRIPYTNYEQSIDEFSSALAYLISTPSNYKENSQNAYKLFQKKFSWDVKGDYLKILYDKALNSGKKHDNE